MALLLLVRHAVTEATGHRLSGAAPGIHLSERGREQATRLAQRLGRIPLAAMYASPLERCVETAEPLAAAHGLSVATVPDLMEVDYGRWTGRSIAQLTRTAMWRRLQEAPSSFRFPEGEALGEVQQRSVRALEELADRHARRIVAVVSHADVIRLVVAHYAGIHVDLFQRLIVSPVSVSAVLLGDRIPRIVRMNDTGAIDDVVARRRTPNRKPTRTARGLEVSRPVRGAAPRIETC
jgi:probable phosphomutase (TIGR03848 family)